VNKDYYQLIGETKRRQFTQSNSLFMFVYYISHLFR